MSIGPEQSEDLASLYRRAFAEYGSRALWNMRPVNEPTSADALAITDALRRHGRMDGRRLAERIEQLADAVGVIFMDGDKPVQPETNDLDKYRRNPGAPSGLWPSSPEISHAMLERYGKPGEGTQR